MSSFVSSAAPLAATGMMTKRRKDGTVLYKVASDTSLRGLGLLGTGPLPARATSVPPLGQESSAASGERAHAAPLRRIGAPPQGTSKSTAGHPTRAVAAGIHNFFDTASRGPSGPAAILRWKAGLDDAGTAFHSVSTWAELMYRKVATETASEEQSPLRTAVCCMLLSRLAPLFAINQELLQSLLNEIFNSIYVEWQEYLSRQQLPASMKARTTSGGPGASGNNDDDDAARAGNLDIVNEYDGDDPAVNVSLKHTVALLRHRHTYFQAFEELQSQRMVVVGRPARVVQVTIDIWRKKILWFVFNEWAGDVQRARRRRLIIEGRIEAKAARMRQHLLRSHFTALRTYVFQRRHQCRVVYEENSRVALVHRMGRRIVELEKANEELKAQWAALMDEHRAVAGRLVDMQNLLKRYTGPPEPATAAVSGSGGVLGSPTASAGSTEPLSPPFSSPLQRIPTERGKRAVTADFIAFGENSGSAGAASATTTTTGAGAASLQHVGPRLRSVAFTDSNDPGSNAVVAGQLQQQQQQIVVSPASVMVAVESDRTSSRQRGVGSLSTEGTDQDAAERREMMDANEASMLGRGSFGNFEKSLTLQEQHAAIEAAGATAAGLPDRKVQLSQYLGLSDGAHRDDGAPSVIVADGGGGEAAEGKKGGVRNSGKKRRTHAHLEERKARGLSDDGAAAAETQQGNNDGGDGKPPAAAAAATTAADANGDAAGSLKYRDVLDWVSLRVQLTLSNVVPLRRCSNFTIDFRDSVRLAYLLVSLGASKALLDDLQAAPTPILKADAVCRVALCFFDEGDAYLKNPINPVDIAKGKGAAISKLLFALFDKFSDLPLVLPTGPLNPRLASALAAASGGGAPKRLLSSPDLRNAGSAKKTPASESGESGTAGDEATAPLRRERSESIADAAAATGPVEPLPDTQYIKWYRELAAEDSDVDLDPDEFADLLSKRKSQVDAIAERISARMSLSIQETELLTPVARARFKKTRMEAISRDEKLRERIEIAKRHMKEKAQLAVWVSEKLSLTHGGKVPADLEDMSNEEVLESVIAAISATAATAASSDPRARLRVLESNLMRRFHLRNIKVRAAGHELREDEVVTLKQLLTALYVMDRPVTVVV